MSVTCVRRRDERSGVRMLVEKMGFKPVDTKWYQAWDVAIRPNEPSAFQKIQKHMAEAQQSRPPAR